MATTGTLPALACNSFNNTTVCFATIAELGLFKVLSSTVLVSALNAIDGMPRPAENCTLPMVPECTTTFPTF